MLLLVQLVVLSVDRPALVGFHGLAGEGVMQRAFFLLHLSLLAEPIGALDDWFRRLSGEFIGVQLYSIGAEGGRIHIEPVTLRVLVELVALELFETHVVGSPGSERVVPLRVALHLCPSLVLIIGLLQSCDVRSSVLLCSGWSLMLQRRPVHRYLALSQFLIRSFPEGGSLVELLI